MIIGEGGESTPWIVVKVLFQKDKKNLLF